MNSRFQSTPPSAQPEQENLEGEEGEGDDEQSADHIDMRSRRGGHTKRYNAILASHNLPISPALPYSLRAKHQAVMTAILHRSLLEGDYARASRAYGLLIRCTEVDVRRIWGIGLEILLRRPEFEAQGEESAGNGEEAGGEIPIGRESKKRGKNSSIYKPENVSKALEFLNRLILFHPYNHRNHTQHFALGSSAKLPKLHKKLKPQPRPSVFEFYPALFNLLIKASPYSSNPQPSSSSPILEEIPDLHPDKIKEQIETLMMTPPWSNMVSLWLIRGMICNWIADLKRKEDTVKSEEMKREAQECFEKVRERGGEVPEGAERGDWASNEDDEDDDNGDDDGGDGGDDNEQEMGEGNVDEVEGGGWRSDAGYES